jgi:hypothetical protein
MKIIRLTENDLARIVRRVINEKVTTLTTTLPMAKPTQAPMKYLLDPNRIDGLRRGDISFVITPLGRGKYTLKFVKPKAFMSSNDKNITGGLMTNFRSELATDWINFGISADMNDPNKPDMAEVNRLAKNIGDIINPIILKLPKV